MTYRNTDENRKYQREWARRKRAGKVTRITRVFTNEERIIMKKKHHDDYMSKKKKILTELFGTHCYFCNFEAVKKGDYTVIHKKSGTKHKKPRDWSLKDIEDINPEEFVRLCGRCHRCIHWSMNYLGMSWNEIEERFALVS